MAHPKFDDKDVYIPNGYACLGYIVLSTATIDRLKKEHFCKGGRTIFDDCSECLYLTDRKSSCE